MYVLYSCTIHSVIIVRQEVTVQERKNGNEWREEERGACGKMRGESLKRTTEERGRMKE